MVLVTLSKGCMFKSKQNSIICFHINFFFIKIRCRFLLKHVVNGWEYKRPFLQKILYATIYVYQTLFQKLIAFEKNNKLFHQFFLFFPYTVSMETKSYITFCVSITLLEKNIRILGLDVGIQVDGWSEKRGQCFNWVNADKY